MHQHRSSELVVAAIAMVLALAACSEDQGPLLANNGAISPSERSSDAPIQTDKDVYYLERQEGQYDAEANATYTNHSARTVYYARCMSGSDGPMYDVQRVGPDADQRSLVGGVWACVGGIPTGSVPPGGSISARVWLGSTISPMAVPPDRSEDRIGTFRITFDLCREYAGDSDDCVSLSEDQRASNTFEIRFAGSE